ncbi:UPF0739 protein C1orf74 homolog [Rhinatrema bivittatum]|uniref:UPF0739 protein C1orf74 homolog n=1 Tax=Rhinatrema bivittatum TaxID=194408 RepID=UPI00112EC008|nr:UPF0739 protein C1orf74 homolog [Rhinatrema bivittatum]XP_029429934.1 UPF0739 protein C1orf74 homolog [Rhinatrema bivittatum]
MASAFSNMLVSIARRCLGTGKKRGFSQAASLDLAAQLLAVDCGLRPAFLYDYSTAEVAQVRKYVEAVQATGLTQCPMHLLAIAGNILILNAERAAARLEALLGGDIFIIDVSAWRSCPTVCDPGIVDQIKAYIRGILNHLKALEIDSAETVSLSEMCSPDWNLCTVFGILLGYPASYWFSTERGFENCLPLVPLRVFSVEASWPAISSRFRLYSFSVPEALCFPLEEHLDAWSENLKRALKGQTNFQDLSVTTETVSLAAVAL